MSGIELDLIVNRGTRTATPALRETTQCSTTSVSETSGKAGLAAKQEHFGSLSLFSLVGKESLPFFNLFKFAVHMSLWSTEYS